jgi:hypothetical protein
MPMGAFLCEKITIGSARPAANSLEDTAKPKPPSKKRRIISVVVIEFVPDVQGRYVGLLANRQNNGGTTP